MKLAMCVMSDYEILKTRTCGFEIYSDSLGVTQVKAGLKHFMCFKYT